MHLINKDSGPFCHSGSWYVQACFSSVHDHCIIKGGRS